MRFNTLNDWLSWQEQLHPQAIDLGLDRVMQVWQRIAITFGDTRVITVAGTNGKGSSVAMLASIYQCAGYAVGTYTSPHVLRYNERIQINGLECEDANLCQAFDLIDQARGDISLSYFEFGTLAALVILARSRLDVVVLEVGLGGRLDAVNIIDDDVALLTSIAVDHQQWLGEDRAVIAVEKAGIFRTGRYAVCGDRQPPVTVAEQAELIGARLLCLGRDFDFVPGLNHDGAGSGFGSDSGWTWQGQGLDDQPICLEQLPVPGLHGTIQYDNAASVIQVIQLLQVALPVERQAIATGLQQVRLSGRFQRLYYLPSGQCVDELNDHAVEVIVDVAHNPAAATMLAQSLSSHSGSGYTGSNYTGSGHRGSNNTGQGPIVAVLGMMADKDMVGFAGPLLPLVDCWFITALDMPRSSSVAMLHQALEQAAQPQGVKIIEGDDLVSAFRQALIAASQHPGGRVLVTGSFYTVAGVLQSR